MSAHTLNGGTINTPAEPPTRKTVDVKAAMSGPTGREKPAPDPTEQRNKAVRRAALAGVKPAEDEVKGRIRGKKK